MWIMSRFTPGLACTHLISGVLLTDQMKSQIVTLAILYLVKDLTCDTKHTIIILIISLDMKLPAFN